MNKLPLNPELESQLIPYVQRFLAFDPENAKPKATTSDPANALTESQQALMLEMNSHFQAWCESPEGISELEAISQMQLADIKKALCKIALNHALRPTLELASSEYPDFPLRSISFGIDFELTFIIGFSGTIGVSFDPTDIMSVIDSIVDGDLKELDLAGSVFISLAVDLGVEAGAIVGPQLGLSISAPDQLGGWSIGGEMAVVDGGGFIVAAYLGYDRSNKIPLDFAGATISAVAGGEDGIEGKVSFTFTLLSVDLGIPPMYQPRTDSSRMMNIKSITCGKTSESGNDEVYMKFRPDDGAVYPHPTWDYYSMNEDSDISTWACTRSIWFTNKVYIELWDNDGSSDDDLIGSKTITWDDVSQLSGTNNNSSLSFDLDNCDGSYSLEVSLMCP